MDRKTDGNLLLNTLNSVGDAIIAADPQGRIVYINPIGLSLTGFSLTDATGRAMAEVIRVFESGVRQEDRNPIERLIRDGRAMEFARETVLFARDGRELRIEGSGGPIKNGQGESVGFVVLFRDVSERSRNRDALRSSEVRYRRLFEAARDGILILDKDSATVTDSNPYMTELLGYTREEFIGKELSDIGFFRDRDAAREAMKVLQNEERIRYEDLPLKSKDGHLRAVEFVSNVYQEDGHAVIQCNIRDISERKRAAEELSQRQSEIVHLNEHLNRAMTETHHRVKNNLQIIAAMIDLRLMEDDQVVSVKELRRVQSSISALAAVHDLLTETTKRPGETDAVSAKQAIEKLLSLVGSTGNRVRIHANIDEGKLSARQATSLAIVLNELLSNAMKYARGDVTVTYKVDDSGGQLSVCDNGPGYPPDFDPSKPNHTGLEMVTMISRWDLGGNATFTNRPEGGACVVVTIR